VRLTVDGDDWTCVRLGHHGRPEGPPRPAVDGGKRTWGRQVSDAASALGQALDEAGCSVAIRTAVVLMSRRAEVTQQRDPGVDLVTVGPAELDKVIRRSPVSIDLVLRRQIEAAIPLDHEASLEAMERAKAARGRRAGTPGRSRPAAGRDRSRSSRNRRG
jgi:hypothetical protein